MNTPDVGSNYLQRSGLFAMAAAALICSIIGGVVAGLINIRISPLAADESDAKYVYTFKNDPLLDPSNPQAFKNALKTEKVAFRHHMGIYDKDGNCDQQGLEDTGVTNPKPCPSGPLMGQQVTQRVGFNNRANLKEALSYVDISHNP